ncbi:type III restriction-modification system EcoP15I [[Pasteurella] mairii]|uniref:site-specific DNA-methyltransferase (adenine-specific) n=1 Tax=[Pasteurella] mairii TaxID=757 RepID=A0A379B4G0_9PAST|nr:type III restriction-modification system EcoP15I [[Pasteurella] mairii]
MEESVNFEQTQNIFIEGENLEVLKALQKSYFNSVKMIYIDPPYNTGSDFVYNDNFAQTQADYQTQTGEIGEDGLLKKAFRKNSKENGHYHSNWLNMMLPRLHLARNLLKDDGVIFISIDDNEQAQLKLLCDEVFGEENFVADVIWKKKYGIQNDAKFFSTNHDFVLVYAKSITEYRQNLLPRTEEQDKRYTNRDNDPRGAWKAGDLSVGRITEKDIYEITTPSGRKVLPSNGRSWVVSQEKFFELVADNRIWFGEKGDNVPSIKQFLSEVKQGRTSSTIWEYTEVGHTDVANRDLKSLMSDKQFFDYPKPVNLVKQALILGSNANDLILDFFAGSSTTAHAVMQLNAEDNGNRRFICVQLPELTDEKSEAYKAGFHNIAEISKERIRRAGSQILQKNDENRPLEGRVGILAHQNNSEMVGKDAHPTDIGFKVFKLTDSHFKQWQSPTVENLSEQLEMFIDNVKDNAEPQAMLYEILLRLGLKLTAKVRWENGVFWIEDEKSQHYAILLERIDEALLADVIAQQPLKVVALDRLFAGNDALKKNAELQMKDAAVAFFVI